jgi:hypothetical protein
LSNRQISLKASVRAKYMQRSPFASIQAFRPTSPLPNGIDAEASDAASVHTTC